MLAARSFSTLAAGLILLLPAAAQQSATQPAQPASASPIDQLRPTYVLGPNDQILIRAFEAEELSDKPFRIEADGMLNLPLVGRVKAAGLSVQELEADLINRLRTFIRNPQVSISVVQFRTDPVFFVGAFVKQGIYPLQGRQTLVEMLTAIGGLQPNASRRIKVTRRTEAGPIPLPNAAASQDGKASSVEISLGSLRENVNPAEDIVLQPYDVISVDRAEMIYVNGQVARNGAYELGERDSMSVIQVITLAGGLLPDAKADQARVLRLVLDSNRRAEIPLNLKKTLTGETADFPLLPNDVLYVPRSNTRAVWSRLGYLMIPLIPTVIAVAAR